jgi:3-oxoacyl-[acyl-carrier-protein] synthase-3
MHASICSIEYYLPESVLSSDGLAEAFPEWKVNELAAKTGIRNRHIATADQCPSDLGVAAAQKLFGSGICQPEEIDFLLFCTQSPDYVMPTTACLMQTRLGISKKSGALDFNLGCSGYVYGLGLAHGLIATGQASTLLLITAETLSKYISDSDRTCRVLFGDGAAATLVRATSTGATIGPFLYGTDGNGGNDVIVPGSGARKSLSHVNVGQEVQAALSDGVLFMNGSKVFTFALSVVPSSVRQLLNAAALTMEDIALFIFHQANQYLLLEIARILEIPRDKLQLSLADSANTGSSSIPIAMKDAYDQGKIQDGDNIVLVGFGVGYSWSATIVRWG